ncbi:MAG TPA: glycosyltransferase family 4 protein [Gemmatimonadota bacterium]|nr:glycosyltransferase family 4 protein [Gemmatimonadota bacterium]
MKVLAVASYSDRAEAETFIGLYRSGVDVEVLCEPDSTGYAYYEAAGVPVSPVPIRRSYDLSAIREVRRRLRSGHHDILHLLTRRTVRNGLVAAAGLDVRIVAYRGVVGMSLSDPSNWITYLHPRVDRIICVSEQVRRDLVNRRFLGFGFPASRAVTIYKGYDIEWAAGPAADLGEFDLPDEAFVVGYLANVRRGKGIDLLIDSAAHLDAALPVYFLLVGEGTDGPAVGRRIAASPASRRFRTAGYRSEAPALMGACDAMALPSASEGLGRAVVESMARATPPIVTPTGASELIEDGVSGRIVPHDDPAAIAAAIAELASDSAHRERMGRAARERIRRDFSIEQTICRTRDLYEELLSTST